MPRQAKYYPRKKFKLERQQAGMLLKTGIQGNANSKETLLNFAIQDSGENAEVLVWVPPYK
jgi:hypothetical protein